MHGFLPVLFLALHAAVTHAQGPGTNATCQAGWEWSFNSLNQSPCEVAAFLGSTCNDGMFFVPALINSTAFYTAPSVAQANPCACSSVFYSALSACAGCQGGQFLLWNKWNEHCSFVYSIYQNNIPTGTRVPHWAYLAIGEDKGFDPVAAKQDSQSSPPESTAIPESSTTSTPPSSTNATATKKSSNAGAIAGGVVGGVVFLLAAVCLVFWFIRRRRRGDAPSNSVQLPMGYHPSSDITPFTSAIPTPKLYDPADPSTFPSSPSSAMYGGGRVASPMSGNTLTSYTGYSMHPPQYSGAPEV
ncbi:hypothetical protein MKEN_01211000 [Mycena kentingensis (nom. inval.)]|nr:hypothetical protein MKEN_01211000 [Mycena kentingensis (nom. inval.)]